MKALFKIGRARHGKALPVRRSCGFAAAEAVYGCGGNSVTTERTNSNWFTGTSYAGIQTSFIPVADHPEYTKEEIVYEVSFDGFFGKQLFLFVRI